MRGSEWFVPQGMKKKHLVVVLSATGDGQMARPIIIFKGKIEQTMCDLTIPSGFIVRTLKKSWMDYYLIKVWIK